MAAWLLLAAGFNHAATPPSAASPAPPREITVSEHDVTLTLTAEPGEVVLTRDVVLILRAVAPEALDVRFPPLEDRLTGFILNGFYDEEPIVAGGTVTVERRARLTPILTEEHRLAPMAIPVFDRARPDAAADWLVTPPMDFSVKPPYEGDPGRTVSTGMTPVWIHPTFRSVALSTAAAVLGLAALWGFVRLLGKIRRRVQLARMSPRERALHELAELLARDLPGQNLLKDFYLELTLIVRRYIERAHAIRAPEQTTEEFLEAAGRDPRFSRETVAKLRAFLQAADLVKFAAYHPDPDATARATDSAKEYIEGDEEERTSNTEHRTSNIEGT